MSFLDKTGLAKLWTSLIALIDTKIPEVMNSTLAQAKASGEFDGADGFSPTISYNKTSNYTVVTITDKNGDKQFRIDDGKAGTNGEDGTDGKTPVKGTDYWTDEDKAEIKAYVDEAILGGEW